MPLPLAGGGSLLHRPPTAGGGGAEPQPPAGDCSWRGRRAAAASRLKDCWNPYLRETTLRLFASVGVSGQVGL